MNDEYAIMSSDLEGYSLSGNYRDMLKHYDEYKKYHLSKTSTIYGNVLVKCKRKVSSISFNFNISKHIWEWKPKIKLKYEKVIEWLWFRFQFEKNYTWDYEKIIKDHLKDND